VLNTNDTVSPRTLTTIDGARTAVPAGEGLVHLQFRRFAGCPICNLHLREVARRHGEITDAGVSEVVLFHSSADVLRRYQADLPFAVVADPGRSLYREFGVENSIRGIFRRPVARAVGRGMLQMRSVRQLAGSLGPTENHLSMPADFLIAPDGAVLARKYGEHADDQWSVDELLALVTQ
jgi:peroxiredoxin